MQYRVNQGDIILMNLDPQAGNEQKGRRPAIVVTGPEFHKRFKKAAMVCPITNTDKDIPTQVKLDGRTKTKGVIMCEQAKILDLHIRNASFLETAPPDIVNRAIEIIGWFIPPMDESHGEEMN